MERFSGSIEKSRNSFPKCPWSKKYKNELHRIESGYETVVIGANFDFPVLRIETGVGVCLDQVHVTGPTKTDFENEKYIIILYLFCTILYTESQILYAIPSCAIGNSNLGAGDMQPPPNAVST